MSESENDKSFPIDEATVNASEVGLRIGSPVGEPLVYLQFYYEDENGEELRFTLRISLEQMKLIADAYPKIEGEINLFANWDAEFEDEQES